MASTEQLIFEILAKDAQASAAFDRFRKKVDDTSGSVDKNSSSLDKNAQSADRAARSHTSLTGALVGTGIAFGPITAGAAAAGAGIAAFGALAVPSIKKIGTALTGPGGLAAGWDTLDNRQRNAALGIQALGRDYGQLARAMEPQVFQVFNQGLTLAHSLLGPVGQLARTSGQGISDFLATFSADSGIQHFISFLATQARPALDSLGADVTHAAHAVFALLQSFGGAGMLELRALTGVFTALDDSVSFLSSHAPGLTSAGLAIGGIALALSKLGALQPVLKITGISGIAGQLAGFTGATKGATLAEKGLLGTTTALGAITPFGWAAAGAIALGGLVFLLNRTSDATTQMIGRLREQDQATGFNTSGYQKLAQQVASFKDNITAATGPVHGIYGAISTVNRAQQELTATQQEELAKGRNLVTFLTTLQDRYHLTRDGAVSLAKAAGVTAAQVTKGGQSARDAATRTEAYADANLKAHEPVVGLAQAVNTLTQAMQKNIGATLTLQGDEIAWKQSQQAALTQLKSNSAGLDANTKNALANRQAILQSSDAVMNYAAHQLAMKGNLRLASAEIQDQIRWLQRHGDKSKFAAAEIRAFRQEEAQIQKAIHSSITVTGSGSWSVRGGNTGGAGHPIRPGQPAALGMFINQGQPGVDDQLIRAQRGELVVPTPLVNAGAVDHLRGIIPGFAAGGVVGDYHGTVPGLSKWLASEQTSTVRAVSDAVEAAFKAAKPPPGGHVGWNPGAGVAQWAGDVSAALRMVGVPDSYKLLVLYQMMTESGGNPNIVNKWDSNWLAGHPSVGLMQVIAGTFDAYAGPYRNTGPFSYGVSVNPMANIFAALNYGAHNGRGFGTGPGQIGSGHGYDSGGYLPTGWSLAYNGTGAPEPVGPAAGTTVININVKVAPGAHKREIGREIAEVLAEYKKSGGWIYKPGGF